MGVVELHALRREPVEVRRGHARAVAAEVRARVVRDDEDKVRLSRARHLSSLVTAVSTNSITDGAQGNPPAASLPYFDITAWQ